MRLCSDCGAEKPLDDFPAHSESAEGRRRQCRSCYRARRRMLLDANPTRKQQTLSRVKAWHEAHPDRVRVHRQKWQDANRVWNEKLSSQHKVKYAKRTGKLVAQPCEVCGSKGQAHHDDYTKPLDVRWLCSRHHKLHHLEMNACQAA